MTHSAQSGQSGQSAMTRVIVGIALLLIGALLGLVGQSMLGADLHPIATGLIVIGLVAIGVGITERRFASREHASRLDQSSERVR